MNDIEKAARLIGLHELEYRRGSDAWYYTSQDSGREEFNPRTNKADLMGLECELGINIYWDVDWVSAFSFAHPTGDVEAVAHYANHPTKFSARAEAVIAVAVKIYDKQFGGE